MGLDFGLQLFSVRKAMQQDVVGTLEKVAEIGYRNVELAARYDDNMGFQVAGLTGSELRKHLDTIDLKTVSCHAMFNEANWEQLMHLIDEVGSPTVIVPIAFFNNRQDVLDYCRFLNKHGELAKKRGIQLYYHNHFQEFQVFEGEKIIDTMLHHTDKELVKFELDTYWTVRGGEDPVQWLNKLGDRCDLIHQKDLPATAQPVSFFDIFGADSQITLETLYKTQEPQHFTEIGEGTLNIASYLDAFRSLGNAKYVFVEQDMTARDELESIGLSYRNIVKFLKKV